MSKLLRVPVTLQRSQKWVQSVQSVPNVKRESEKMKPAKVTKEKLSVCVFEKYKKLT